MKKILSTIVAVVIIASNIGVVFGAAPTQTIIPDMEMKPAKGLKIDVTDLTDVKTEPFYYENGSSDMVQMNYVKEDSILKVTASEDVYDYVWDAYIVSNGQDKIYINRDIGNEVKNTYSFMKGSPNFVFNYFYPSSFGPFKEASTEFIDDALFEKMGYREGSTVYFRMCFSERDTDPGVNNGQMLIDAYYFAFKIGDHGNQGTTPIAAQNNRKTAQPTPSKVFVNNKETAFDAYNIDGANYFKLRDLAYAVNGSEKQFDIAFDSNANAINILSNQAYKTAGGEMTQGDGKAQTAVATNSKLLLDGKEVSLTAYNINGNNYFKLRDIGKILNFAVDWDSANNTIQMNSAKPYTE